MKFPSAGRGAEQGSRAPQGARGLKSVKIIYSDGAEMVVPRKGRVG